jgi:hypothetical protein
MLLALGLLLCASVAHAQTATITCTVTGSALPGANNSRALTLPDTDLQLVLNWIKTDQLQVVANKFNGGVTAGFNPTNPQLEWGWFQVSIVNGSIAATQVHGTTPPTVPPPINFQ